MGARCDVRQTMLFGLTSSITFFTWTQRFICCLGVESHSNGWAFRSPDRTRALAGDYRNNIFSKLKTILEMTTLIKLECKIWDACSIQRSGWRFFDTHCLNMGVAPHLIELQAGWPTVRARGNRTDQPSMIHTYAEVRNMKETLMIPSKAC